MAIVLNYNDIPYDSEEENETFQLGDFLHPHDLSFRIAFKNLETSKTKAFFEENSDLWNHVELVSFAVSSCNLQVIPPHISRLINLQILSLTGNRTSTLPEQLSLLINLTKLNLSRNQITQIPESLFSNCTKIEDLQLFSNPFLKVPDSINYLHNLTTLSLSQCKLGSIPNSIIHLPSLSDLNLFDNLIETLPSVPFMWKNLQTLNLAKNCFKYFPFSKHVVDAPDLSSAMPKLKKLHLEGNQISYLHESISQLKTLDLIDISSNKLTDISALIPLKELGHLVVALNRIKVIPEAIWQNECLKYVDVSYNDIESLPEDLDKHPSLMLMKLYGNAMETYAPATKDMKKFSITDARGPDLIIPRLYLGSLMNARNKHKLRRLGVTHIVTMMPDSDCMYTEDFFYHVVPIQDDDRENIAYYFQGVHKFIEDALNANESNCVFVHCAAGISRSSTIVISYLMAKQSKTFVEAYQQVKAQRPIISPNNGFQQQLKKFEKELGKNSNCKIS